MLHGEMAATTEALDIEDGHTGANSGSERDDQGVRNGKKDFDRAEPTGVALHSTSKNPSVVVLVEYVFISRCGYWPLRLNAYYDPSSYCEDAV